MNYHSVRGEISGLTSTYGLIIGAAVGIVLIRLVFIGLMGLMPQDAYYHFYGEHLALSYFDHPPAIAYILRLFTTVLGKKVFVLKLADSVITLFTLFSFYKLCSLFLSKHATQKAFILLFSTLMVTLLSLVSTPDVPLMLFWCLSLIALYHAVFLGKNHMWIMAGILMGLAFDSKYTGLFLPVGTLLFVIMSKKHRGLLLSPWFWTGFIFFILAISPVIIWNVENDFASFRFQSASRMESMGGIHFTPLSFLGVVGHQAAILMPVLFFAVIFYCYRFIKKHLVNRRSISTETLFLCCFFVPLFFGFFTISFIYWVKINWLMPAYITGIILISRYFNVKWIRYQLIFSLFIHIILAVEVLYYPVNIKSDDTWMGWDKLAMKVNQLKAAYPKAFVFSSDDYKTSAALNFYLPEMVYSRNIIGEPALQFDFIGTDLNVLQGRDAIFLNSVPGFKNEQKEGKYPSLVNRHFNSVTELEPLLIKNGKQTIRKFLVFYCTGYKRIQPGH